MLGKYAGAVIGSYVASLVLLAVLVALSLYRNARSKRALAELEARVKK